MLGPNEPLVGKPISAEEFQTPALLLDLDLLRLNIEHMAGKVRAARRLLRPHVKSHKCVSIARLQLEAGAIGLCCATVREVEAMAGAGFDGILLTAPVATRGMAARIGAARQRVPSLMAAIDSQVGLDLLAGATTPDRPIGILIDIDVGVGRTGLADPDEAVRLAARATASKTLRYRGVQAYYGNLQHVASLAERLVKAAEQWRHLARFTDALAGAGLTPEIISGGGTGTHHFDLAEGPFTEIQAGSYIFMDRQYDAVELTPEGSPFHQSLSIAAHVVSANQPGRVTLDAGLKSMSTDAGPASVIDGAPAAASYRFMGDEHGALNLTAGEALPTLGSLVRLAPPHCDPTVNLHDRLHVTQGQKLVDIWPIEARGY